MLHIFVVAWSGMLSDTKQVSTAVFQNLLVPYFSAQNIFHPRHTLICHRHMTAHHKMSPHKKGVCYESAYNHKKYRPIYMQIIVL